MVSIVPNCMATSVVWCPPLTPAPKFHGIFYTVALWLGMAKAGVCTALVNIHIKGPPLVHAIRTALDQSKRQVVVVDQSLADFVACPDIVAELSPEVSVVGVGAAFQRGL